MKKNYNFFLTYNKMEKKENSKRKYYDEAKYLADELNEELKVNWVGSTKSQLKSYVKELRKRRDTKMREDSLLFTRYLTALELSEALNKPLRYDDISGTDSQGWKNEIRRLQAIMKRLQKKQQKEEEKKQREEERLRINRNDEINRLIEEKKFNELLNMILIPTNQFTEEQATKIYNAIMSDGKYVIKATTYNEDEKKPDETYFTVNETSKDSLIYHLLMKGNEYELQQTDFKFSDTVESIYIKTIIRLELIPARRLLKEASDEEKHNSNKTSSNKTFGITSGNKDGKFFPFINTSILDLSKYQIFTQEQARDTNIINTIGKEHCLIHALRLSSLSESLLNSIKLGFSTGFHIRKSSIKDIAKEFKLNIELHWIDTSGKFQKTTYTYGDTDEVHKICLHHNHFFLYEDTIYSKYFIDNYEQLSTLDNENKFNIVRVKNVKGKNYYTYSDSSKINTLALVKILTEKGLFQKLDMSMFSHTASHIDLKDHIYLDNIHNEQRPCEQLRPRDEIDAEINLQSGCSKINLAVPLVYFADCESFVNKSIHNLYMLGCVSSISDKVKIFEVSEFDKTKTKEIRQIDGSIKKVRDQDVPSEQYLIYRWLSFMTSDGQDKRATCYFHNLKYDFHVIGKYLNIVSIVKKDNQLYSVKIRYKQSLIELRDSYKLISFKLANFNKEFNLPKEIYKKEAISYEYYTRQNHNQRVKIDEYRGFLSHADKITFDEIIKNEPSYDPNTKTFNPFDYYKSYLNNDCLTLKYGMLKFNELIMEITENKISIFECLTISSLTDKFMKISGAYNGIYEVCGNLRDYISRAVMGGRVHVNEKYKKQVINEEISDYDGVSLYPSSISRLSREIGLPTGQAIRMTDRDRTNWRNFIYAVMTVKITKVNKFQQMPFITHRGKDSTDYKNEAPSEPIIIDKITLEDYIKFHDIEYEILDGVYWNTGVNRIMGDVITKLFNARLKCKKEGNTTLSNVIKLMLNSAYGKTVMKKSSSEHRIMSCVNKKMWNAEKGMYIESDHNPFNNYIQANFNTIKKFSFISDKVVEVEAVCSDMSFNRAHIGCSILSMSKRIMNEVFDVANSNNLPIFYTDTDSIHMLRKDVKTLENKYKEEYNKELNGEELEQFHTDFQLKGARKKEEVYAIKSIFLGKKSYIDVLQSINDDGNIINGYHIRLKGITEEGLEHSAKKFSECGKIPEYFKLYESLSKGNEIPIILNPLNTEENSKKVLFEFKDGRVYTKKEFIRNVKF